MNAQKLRTQLEHIIDHESNSIRAYIAQEALSYSTDDPERFFKMLVRCGCTGGLVIALVSHMNEYAFYDRHYAEIESLREEFAEVNIEPITIEGNLKIFFAWFAYEEVAFKMTIEYGLDV